MRIDRREFLGYGRYVAGALAGLPLLARGGRPAAQTLKKIRLTLPWVPEGSNLFAWVARNKGFWKKRGLNVDIARGYGSGAAVQALAAGQFDFAEAATSAAIMQSAKGLPLTCIGQLTYKSTMGVCVPADSPIQGPKDLEGKVVGTVPTSGEYPFFPVFARNAGIDEKKIKFFQTTPEVRYRSLISRQFDAITGFAISVIPALVSQNFPVRFMLYGNYGMNILELSMVAPNKTVKEDPDLCQAVLDGALEAVAFTYVNPAESIDIFLTEVKEAGLTPAGRDYTRLGLGIFLYSGLVDEVREHGLGWVDPAKIAELNDLVATYLAPKDAPRTDVTVLYTNRFAGKVKLTPEQWADAMKRREEFARFFA
jgi:ABC-type nitrate/sulfonate/bicarbonate transport system substrate-binding protein